MLIEDEKRMRALGARLIAACDHGGVITLAGELGSGKTTLVRGALQAAGVTGGIRSPTYTLVEYYPLERFAVAHFDLYRLADEFGATCVLKGSGTLIAEIGRRSAINTAGNPGMASAGMGDVLSGIVGALLGQGMAPFDAARAAVLIHALAADDYCLDNDQVGLVASDVIERVPAVIKRLRPSTC